jgi:hypothetical protein
MPTSQKEQVSGKLPLARFQLSTILYSLIENEPDERFQRLFFSYVGSVIVFDHA